MATDPSSSKWCTALAIGSTPSIASIAPPARAHVLRIRSAVVGAVVVAGAAIASPLCR
jgi:hypothetical protein